MAVPDQPVVRQLDRHRLALTVPTAEHGYYYEAVALHLLRHEQSLLALEMNGGPLPIEHGAPLRLRVESQLGFKMVKWVQGIELVERVDHIRFGRGGFREHQQFYSAWVGM